MNVDDDYRKGKSGRQAKQKWAVELKQILDELVAIDGRHRSSSRTYFGEVITQLVNNAVLEDEEAINQVIELFLSVPVEQEEAPGMSTEDFLLLIGRMFGLDGPPPPMRRATRALAQSGDEKTKKLA
jgi:hypothetical protein